MVPVEANSISPAKIEMEPTSPKMEPMSPSGMKSEPSNGPTTMSNEPKNVQDLTAFVSSSHLLSFYYFFCFHGWEPAILLGGRP